LNIQRYVNGQPVESEDLGKYNLHTPQITNAVNAVNDRIGLNKNTFDWRTGVSENLE